MIKLYFKRKYDFLSNYQNVNNEKIIRVHENWEVFSHNKYYDEASYNNYISNPEYEFTCYMANNKNIIQVEPITYLNKYYLKDSHYDAKLDKIIYYERYYTTCNFLMLSNVRSIEFNYWSELEIFCKTNDGIWQYYDNYVDLEYNGGLRFFRKYKLEKI